MSAKAVLKRVVPRPGIRVATMALDRWRRSRRRNLPWQRQQRITAELIARHGSVVQAGPFRGLRLPAEGSWGNLAAFLVGSYEHELHGVIDDLIGSGPRRVINIGSAEGYYAVGLALRLPQARVYAFDIDEQAQRLTLETAAMNGVAGRVQVTGQCTPDRLEQILTPDTLIIVDCEGCEFDVLRPDRVPSLSGATMLVELHDFVDPQISLSVLTRFRPTHSISVVPVRQRVTTDYPALQNFASSDRAIAVDEARPTEPHPMEWAVLCPLAKAVPATTGGRDA
jgi:hypothetical protein